MKSKSIAVTAFLLLHCAAAHPLDFRGNISSEFSYFGRSSVGTDNFNFNSSVAAEVEVTHDLNDNIRLIAHPFARWDEHDDERSRFVLRELLVSANFSNWEINAGVGTVFWGVTESRQLVDLINQTDAVEATDNEDKLGQLMLNVKWFSDYGEFEAFLLPRFEERTFKGPNGRPFLGITVDRDLTTFESAQGDQHLDVALRWTHSVDAWDIGLHYFDGTLRDPLLQVTQTDTGPVLAPRYLLVQQAGWDAQGLYGDLAVKTELIVQGGDEVDLHVETVSGIEYTWVGALSPMQEKEMLPDDWCTPDTRNPFKKLICNDRIDLGLVLEYLWDERGESSNQPFQNDLLAGVRLSFNDTATTDALLGLVQDLDGGATTLSLEASTRLFESFRLSVESTKFFNTGGDTSLQAFENESYIKADLSYFF